MPGKLHSWNCNQENSGMRPYISCPLYFAMVGAESILSPLSRHRERAGTINGSEPGGSGGCACFGREYVVGKCSLITQHCSCFF